MNIPVLLSLIAPLAPDDPLGPYLAQVAGTVQAVVGDEDARIVKLISYLTELLERSPSITVRQVLLNPAHTKSLVEAVQTVEDTEDGQLFRCNKCGQFFYVKE